MKFNNRVSKIPIVILGIFIISFLSCKKEEIKPAIPKGPEYGVVKDTLGRPVGGASVYLVPASEQAASCNPNRLEYSPTVPHIIRPQGERASFIHGADANVYLGSIDEPLEYVVYLTPKPGTWQVAYTDPEGRYWFKDVKPGDYYIYIKPPMKEHHIPGGSRCCAITSIKGDEDTRKEITLFRNVSLEEMGKDWDFLFYPGNQPTPDGLYGIRAEDCGECHIEQYIEWKDSSHAQ
ncbi:MAG: hypothetical protein HY999_01640, partial [Nitrospinae bacterium]|nr:hypothetical protein [Nitrospinota bacterium]